MNTIVSSSKSYSAALPQTLAAVFFFSFFLHFESVLAMRKDNLKTFHVKIRQEPCIANKITRFTATFTDSTKVKLFVTGSPK